MVPLFVIGTFLLFVVADLVVIALRRRARAAQPAAATVPIPEPDGIPAGMFLHPGHVWATVDPAGTVRVGLDELAQRLLGPVEASAVRLPESGRRVERGETLFAAKVGDTEIPFVSPVTGVVESARVPAAGPKGAAPESWWCAVRAERLGPEIRLMRVAGEAQAWMASEFARLRESLLGLQPAHAATLPDGGEPADGLLQVLDGKGRATMVREFLARSE